MRTEKDRSGITTALASGEMLLRTHRMETSAAGRARSAPSSCDGGRPSARFSSAQERALSALQAISRHTGAEPDPRTCLGLLSGTVAAQVGASRCAFFTLTPDGRAISAQVEAHNIARPLLDTLPSIPCDARGRDPGGRVVFGDEVYISAPDDRGEPDPCRRLVEMLGARDALAVAWKAGERRFGALAVFDSRSGGGFTDEDAWVLQVAAMGAGLIWQHKQAEMELSELKDREADQLRHEAERMAELEGVKTNFLNLASHELRGPVGVARGYLSMIRDGDFGRLGGRLREPMEMITAKVDQIWRVVEQMVEATRREESRIPLRAERIDLRQTVATAAEEVRPLAEAAHTLVVRLPAQPVPVMGDRGRLTDVVASLLDNAVKYSPNGGEVGCELAVRDGQARIDVHDQGVGIAGCDLPRMFTRFGRIITPENSHIPGTGLGLYLARELVTMHGGDVTVRSVPRRGSIFTVVLPLAPG